MQPQIFLFDRPDLISRPGHYAVAVFSYRFQQPAVTRNERVHEQDIRRDCQKDQQEPFGPVPLQKCFEYRRIGAGHPLLEKNEERKGADGGKQLEGGDIFVQDDLQLSQERDKWEAKKGRVVREEQQADMKIYGIKQQQEKSGVQVKIVPFAQPLDPEDPGIGEQKEKKGGDPRQEFSPEVKCVRQGVLDHHLFKVRGKHRPLLHRNLRKTLPLLLQFV